MLEEHYDRLGFDEAVARRRRRWKLRQRHRRKRAKRRGPTAPRRRWVFIDETWAKTNMTRLRGRCPRGQRLIEKVPHGHWKTTTLIAALGPEGVLCSTVVDGAVNADVFESFDRLPSSLTREGQSGLAGDSGSPSEVALKQAT